ncbi:ferric reductase-like transmembrane domain-containing protein [Planomonospora venezuelensis]|uniref:DMSO/TMAO reductase YedYZ, heme-binding membrane subunit n=1 Tax=Planomonospora venezuelensis TaxID=1999 RepID=A0A841CZY0_PLAVE|nr:ferric reductase-like transmembrane domain-containing protein [Planomonospora venezuelensis]MBB5961547.1 hypothetical protein [Planomonospora venezuelensis]GIM98693.1 hypothetical protein Pve01_03520 [Planomonospora venezuelensis]
MRDIEWDTVNDTNGSVYYLKRPAARLNDPVRDRAGSIADTDASIRIAAVPPDAPDAPGREGRGPEAAGPVRSRRGQARHCRREASGLDRRGNRIMLGAGVTAVTVGVLMAGRTEAGLRASAAAWELLSFYGGVLALVALTCTVALGLLSADRVVLSARGRIRAQLCHRAAALTGMTFLATHVLMKIAEGRIPTAAAVVPTSAPTTAIGLGVVASDAMVLIFATGIARAGFADSRRPWVWRLLHGSAYLAWPAAIMHGLGAGRQPAAWVSWSYVVCLVAVGAALLIRVISALRSGRAPAPAEAPAERSGAAEGPAGRPGTAERLAGPEEASPTSIVGRVPRRAREHRTGTATGSGTGTDGRVAARRIGGGG